MSAIYVKETIWKNPNADDAVLDIYVGTKPLYSMQMREHARRAEGEALRTQQTGYVRYIVRAGGERAIDSQYDWCIQRVRCLDANCHRAPYQCANDSHRKMIVGGLGPQLIRARTQTREVDVSAQAGPSSEEAPNAESLLSELGQLDTKDDHVCTTCGNDRCSKWEKACWKCGAKIL